jgi:hypothetical protein
MQGACSDQKELLLVDPSLSSSVNYAESIAEAFAG